MHNLVSGIRGGWSSICKGASNSSNRAAHQFEFYALLFVYLLIYFVLQVKCGGTRLRDSSEVYIELVRPNITQPLWSWIDFGNIKQKWWVTLFNLWTRGGHFERGLHRERPRATNGSFVFSDFLSLPRVLKAFPFISYAWKLWTAGQKYIQMSSLSFAEFANVGWESSNLGPVPLFSKWVNVSRGDELQTFKSAPTQLLDNDQQFFPRQVNSSAYRSTHHFNAKQLRFGSQRKSARRRML